jgi:hypothetical protein
MNNKRRFHAHRAERIGSIRSQSIHRADRAENNRRALKCIAVVRNQRTDWVRGSTLSFLQTR